MGVNLLFNLSNLACVPILAPTILVCADDEDPDASLELLPEPVYDVEDLPERQVVRERFLAGKKLSRQLTPLRPLGGEGLHEKD